MSVTPDARSFLSVLAEAHLSRGTGILRVAGERGRLAVALVEGRVVALESEAAPGAPSTEEDRELAALLAEAFTGGEPSVSRAAARQTLLEGLRSSDAEAVFEPGRAESADPPLDFDTEELLREAVHAVDATLVNAVLGDLDRPLRSTLDSRQLQERALTPSEGYLLSRLDGATPAREVLELLPLEAESARRCLLGLLVAGLVEFAAPLSRPTPAAVPDAPEGSPSAATAPELAAATALRERRQSILNTHARVASERNHFEVLGLTREASEAEIKAAYFRLAKQFHPDTLGELSDLREAVEEVFSRLGAAFQVLSQPKSRAAYLETLSKWSPSTAPAAGVRRPPPSVPGAPLPPSESRGPSPEDLAWIAEESLKRAEELLSEGKFFDVTRALESQVGALAGRSRSRGRLILAQAYLHNPQWLHRAEEQLRAVTKEDPQNPEAYYLLGTIYKTKGLRTRAANMFRQALEVRPGHKPAADELLSLEKAPPPPRRWFRSSRSSDEK